MFEAVFFDMDGVTIDSEPQWQESESALMARFGYQWSEVDQAHCVGGPLSRVGEYMAGIADSPYDGPWFMRELISLQMAAMRSGVALLPGVAALIQQCRQLDIPVALVSASPRKIIDAAMSSLPTSLFDFSISSDDVRNTKPDPEPYLSAASRAKVDIGKSLVIEDSRTGIASGYAAGAYVLAVPHFFSIEPQERLRVVETLEGESINRILSYFS